jgi:hypothetical protein
VPRHSAWWGLEHLHTEYAGCSIIASIFPKSLGWFKNLGKFYAYIRGKFVIGFCHTAAAPAWACARQVAFWANLRGTSTQKLSRAFDAL